MHLHKLALQCHQKVSHSAVLSILQRSSLECSPALVAPFISVHTVPSLTGSCCPAQ